MDGHTGTDTLDYSAYTDPVTVNLSTNTAIGTGGVFNFENVYGGSVADALTGDAGDNLLRGNAGNDTLTGGLGVDSADYSNAPSAVTVNLSSGTVSGGADDDTLSGIENVTGSAYNDILTSDAADNTLSGGLGDDTYHFGDNAGTDTVVDAAGDDTIDFTPASVGVTFNLAQRSVSGPQSSVSYSGSAIEHLIGGGGDDSFEFSGSAVHPGDINGGLGDDTLDHSGYASAVTVDLQARSATGLTSFASVENLVGSGNTDTLQAATLGSSFVVTAADAGTADGLDFTSYETLLGGAGVDSLSFNGHASGRDIQLTGLGATDGFNGTESSLSDGFYNINTLTGSAHSDSLTGLSAGTWQINGALNTYTSGNVLTFSAIEDLLGGSGADTFNFVNGATLESGSGTLDGQGGTDLLSYATYTTAVTVNLNTGTATGTDGISNIENVTGGSAGDTLTSDAADNTFTGGAGNDTYHFLDGWGDDTVVELVGGGTDTMDFSQISGTISIDSDVTTLTVDDGTSTSTHSGNQVENIIGSATATNTLDYSTAASGQEFTLIALGSDTGFKVDVTGVGSFDNINAIIGANASGDILNTLDAASTFDIQTATSTYESTNSLDFSKIDTVNAGTDADGFTISGTPDIDLNAGAGADDFTFKAGATLTGVLDGQGGLDTLSFLNYGSLRHLTLTGLGSTDGFAGTEAALTGSFANIDILAASSLNGDSLTGANLTASWGIDGTNQYTSTNTLDFSGFEDLIGGTGADTFNLSGAQTHDLSGGAGNDELVLANGAQLIGSFDGEAGTDTLDYSAYTTARSITLTAVAATDGFTGTETALSAGFTNVDSFVGSTTANNDRLYGLDQDTNWAIGTTNQVTVGSNSATFGQIELLYGGALVDTFNITGTGNAVSLRGGAGSDAFIFADGAAITGGIDGQGSGNNTLDYSAYITPVLVNLHANSVLGMDPFTAIGTAGVINIQDVLGGSNDDILIGSSDDNILAGNGGSDHLQGRVGDDTYIFGDNWGTNDTLIENAGEGTDTIDFSAATVDLSFTLGSVIVTDAGGNKVTHTGHNVERLVGGSGADQFIFSANGVTLAGGVGTIDGRGGVDTPNYSAYTRSVTVNLKGGVSTGTGGIANN